MINITTKKGMVYGVGVLLIFLAGMVVNTLLTNNSDSIATSAEAGFARDMSIHHEQAIDMSFIIRENTDNQEIRNFAYDIINTQATQRGMMLGWLDLWNLEPTSVEKPMKWMHDDMRSQHHMNMVHTFTPGALMPGMATTQEMNELRGLSDEDAEKLFLELMIRHHQGGVMMAQGVVDRSDKQDVVRLAQTMVDGQQTEVEYMEDLLVQY